MVAQPTRGLFRSAFEGHQSVTSLEAQFGHPGDMWAALQEKIQLDSVQRFVDVQDDFLAILWCLDQYRVAGVPPKGMGNPQYDDRKRLEAVYRSKGIWWANLMALLLENRTEAILAPRKSVQGFSQVHTIDVAWPAREGPIEDPYICLVTKLSGAPGFMNTPARGAISDWTNRRKELKFAAVDLKLCQSQQHTSMTSWEAWRHAQPPKVYFLWGARIGEKDRLAAIDRELQALVDTYLDGVGVFAYTGSSDGTAYETQPTGTALSWPVDAVLDDMAQTIKDVGGPASTPPVTQGIRQRATDITALADDSLDEAT